MVNILPESYDKIRIPAEADRLTVADSTLWTPQVIFSSTLTDIFRDFRRYECEIRGIIKKAGHGPHIVPPSHVRSLHALRSVITSWTGQNEKQGEHNLLRYARPAFKNRPIFISYPWMRLV